MFRQKIFKSNGGYPGLKSIAQSFVSAGSSKHPDKEKETIFRGNMDSIENKKFSDLSVMVIDQNTRQTYLEFKS